MNGINLLEILQIEKSKSFRRLKRQPRSWILLPLLPVASVRPGSLEYKPALVTQLFGEITNPDNVAQYLREVFWLVPMDIALRLREEREYLAEIAFEHYERLIKNGKNKWELGTLAAMSASIDARTFAIATPEFSLDFARSEANSLAEFFSGVAQFNQTFANFERREEEWKLQGHLADKDRQIADQQVLHAQNQKQVALKEQQLAQLQSGHVEAVFDFLKNKFTNAELFEWMSGVLGNVYAYFLQQSTALAQLAQSQLEFER